MMRSMFGTSCEVAAYTNDGCSPSLMNMVSHNYIALSGLRISWLCHFTGLYPVLAYYAPSGLNIIALKGSNIIANRQRPSLNARLMEKWFLAQKLED